MTNRLFHADASSPQNLRLDVVILREQVGEKEMWVAQCLQYDIATQASTLEILLKRIQTVVVSNMILDLESGKEPFSNLKPAPQRYWKEYQESKMTMEIVPKRSCRILAYGFQGSVIATRP